LVVSLGAVFNVPVFWMEIKDVTDTTSDWKNRQTVTLIPKKKELVLTFFLFFKMPQKTTKVGTPQPTILCVGKHNQNALSDHDKIVKDNETLKAKRKK
jgi:hypothetical protein